MSLIRVRHRPLEVVLDVGIDGVAYRDPPAVECHGCRWDWPVMRCLSGALHIAIGRVWRSRFPGAVVQCDSAPTGRPTLRLVP